MNRQQTLHIPHSDYFTFLLYWVRQAEGEDQAQQLKHVVTARIFRHHLYWVKLSNEISRSQNLKNCCLNMASPPKIGILFSKALAALRIFANPLILCFAKFRGHLYSRHDSPLSTAGTLGALSTQMGITVDCGQVKCWFLMLHPCSIRSSKWVVLNVI